MKGIILKDDARYYHTENYLRGKGHIFYEADISTKNLDFIVFPFKREIDSSIYNDEYFAALKNNVLIFSGIRSAYVTEKCAKHKLIYYAMMEDRGVAVKNAVPTSEGVVAYLITNRSDTVANSRVLVIGYGVCGRDLSGRLKALGANVYALVRNREKECAAYVDSITPIYLDELFKLTFEVIINTVPGQVLDNEMLEKTEGALLIDIASEPYGFNMEYAKRLNGQSALLPGIPGKYAVRTAGEILGEYINHILIRGR